MNTRATLHATLAGERAILRSLQNAALDVDVATGMIRGAAVMTIGPAEGWGWDCDRTTLEQVRDAINAAGGMPSRFKHQGMNADGTPMMAAPEALGTKVAMLSNARVDGSVLRADVQVGTYAEHVPGQGNVRAYLLNMAKEAPTEIGLSADFFYSLERTGDRAVARVKTVNSIDFVDRPASNRRGLLAELPGVSDSGALPAVDPLPTNGGVQMDPNLLALLVSMGLAPQSTPEQSQAFLSALPDDKKRAVFAQFPDAAPKPPAAPMVEQPPAQLAARPTLQPAAADDPTRAVLAAENARVSGIREVGKLYGHDDAWTNSQIAAGADVPTAQRAALSKLSEQHNAYPVHVRDDRNMSSLPQAIGDSIQLRAGLSVKNPHERARDFRGLTLVETARAYLTAIGIDTRGMGRNEVASLVFNRGKLAAMGRAALAQTSGDFSNILADTIGKTLRTAYDEYPTTWQQWVRRATAPDFKTITRTQLSEGSSLKRVRKGGEYPNATLSDSKETYVLSKYGDIHSLSWETIINDDLNAFARIPELKGRAAKRLENELVYYTLLANAAMNDTGALFNSTVRTTAGGHANLASANAAITVAALNIGVGQMMVQTGLNGATIGVRPSFLIVPPAIAGTAWEVVNSTTNTASSNANVKNRFGPGGQVGLTVIEEPMIQNGVTIYDQDGVAVGTASGTSTGWHLIASNSFIDTVELCFLEDEPAPVLTEEDGFRVDGRQYKIRHTVAAAALDFRGMWKNTGA